MKDEEFELGLTAFISEREFDFSNNRTQKRNNYLGKKGLKQDDIPDECEPNCNLQEEGIDGKVIQDYVRKVHCLDTGVTDLIDSIQTSESYWDEYSSEKYALLANQNEVSHLNEKDVREFKKKFLQQRYAKVKKINRKSRMFIEKSFLKFHLWQHLVFYVVILTVPSLSFVGCV